MSYAHVSESELSLVPPQKTRCMEWEWIWKREKSLGCSELLLDLSPPERIPDENCVCQLLLAHVDLLCHTEALKSLPMLYHGSSVCTWCRGDQISLVKNSTVTLTQMMQIRDVKEDVRWMWVGDGSMHQDVTVWMRGVLVHAAPGDPVLTLLQVKGNNSSLGNRGKGFRAAFSFTGYWDGFTLLESR